MDKIEYISRQFARAEKKKYEHYVVTRIWHLLNDLSLKIITQQYVTRPDGRALTDLFFPQLNLHVEIDEGHHKKRIDLDKLREADIINATGHEIWHVDVTKDIESINGETDSIIDRIRQLKTSIVNFQPWDLDAEMNPETYIRKGSIDLSDNCSFRTSVDAASCFGKKYKPKGIQTGGVVHPIEPATLIWFPKLYENEGWDNSISDNEETIKEIAKSPETATAHYGSTLKKGMFRRIVFARVKSPLGDYMYRFKGVYQLNHQISNEKDGLTWNRVSRTVKTYDPTSN